MKKKATIYLYGIERVDSAIQVTEDPTFWFLCDVLSNTVTL